MEMHIIRRDIGQITLAAGMIDDTIGWILLSVVAGLASSGKISPLTAGRSFLSVLLVLGVAYTVGRRAVGGLIRALDNQVGGDMVKITAVMILALTFGAVTQQLRLEAVLGAFVAGVLVGQVKRFDDRLRHIFEPVALGVFAPVFFASSGLRVDLAKLAKPNVLAAGLVVLAIAIAGKFAGAYAGARASRLGHWEALSLGAGMNARGAMEIIVATVGLSRGILTPEMYSIILMVAIVTSLMAPPLLRWTLSHVELSDEEQQRLDREERRRNSFVANLKRVLLPVRAPGDSDVAAKVVGLLVHDEDVEVTSLYLHNGGQGKADRAEVDRAKKVIESHVEPVRSRTRSEEDDPAAAILSEASGDTTCWCWPAPSGGRAGRVRCSTDSSTMSSKTHHARCSSSPPPTTRAPGSTTSRVAISSFPSRAATPTARPLKWRSPSPPVPTWSSTSSTWSAAPSTWCGSMATEPYCTRSTSAKTWWPKSPNSAGAWMPRYAPMFSSPTIPSERSLNAPSVEPISSFSPAVAGRSPSAHSSATASTTSSATRLAPWSSSPAETAEPIRLLRRAGSTTTGGSGRCR